ncbi:hypothetical protein K1T71_002162 [Dendrolimus kikuchii]|uniref:Uncharacterized protein n=1 Tax=Dendrolimus kikuchii TaxID=765133 RepID=A0ACC1DFQ3_9NEOP|nr:hypothetical protein K1T71_002162 [Dendrolimus kikuchii]
MYLNALFFLLLSTLALSNGNTLQGTIDVQRLQKILQDNVKSRDLTAIYYAVRGLKQLNVAIPDVCEVIKILNYDVKNIEQVFYLTNVAALTNCQNAVKPEVLGAATVVLDKKDATLAELYYAVYTLKALGKGSIYDKEDALKNLIQILKKDDSPANYGYVFALCEHMGCGGWTATHAEGVILSADESDGKALHFEGGLPVTSFVLSTIARTYKKLNKPFPLTDEQKYKFAEYLLSRRSVNTPKGATLLLEGATAIADDVDSPISIMIKGKKYITSEVDTIEFSITDLIGRPVKNLKPEEVIAQSGTRLADDVVVLSKQPLNQKPNEPTTFILNLNKIKAQYGLYKIALSAGSKTTNVNVAVLGEIQVTTVEVGIGDVDGTTSPKVTTVTYPNKLGEKLQADHMQKVSLKFSVRDKWNKPVLVQQAFVRVATQDNDQETIFVAEPDNAKAYKVELRFRGRFLAQYILGSNCLLFTMVWVFGIGPREVLRAAGKSYRGPLPEIAHIFRSPDARPPRLVSDVFACACAAPLLLLLILWAKLRINLSSFPFTPSALVFHLALGASLGLYAVLWLQLSMFETMRYLLPLGLITFLSGHRLLRRLVQDKAQPR